MKLKGKGRVEKGFDADLCILDANTLDIDTVIAKGKMMSSAKMPIVYGTFEEKK